MRAWCDPDHIFVIVGGVIDQERIADWVCERSPYLDLYRSRDQKGRLAYSAIGWVDSAGVLVAGVVYDSLTRTRSLYRSHSEINIDMHIASVPGSAWMDPFFFREAFRYPFEQLGVQRVTGKAPASHAASHRFQLALGFTREGVIREALAGGEDLHIFGMLRRECRWIGAVSNGIRERRQRTPSS